MKTVSLDKWLGRRGPAIDPDQVRFVVAEAPVFADCKGCMFIGQPSAICRRACEIAVASGAPDCDDALPNGKSLIYVADERDPRQMDLIENIIKGKI